MAGCGTVLVKETQSTIQGTLTSQATIQTGSATPYGSQVQADQQDKSIQQNQLAQSQHPPQPAQKSDSPALSYKDWFIPKDIIQSNSFDHFGGNENKTDCVGLYNGSTGGGDLLSTIIADADARALMTLKTYTPDYAKKLEGKISEFTLNNSQEDFYAFYVCHLKDNVDVAAGYLWPHLKSTTLQEGKFTGTLDPKFGDKNALFVLTYNNIHFYDNIQLLDNTATGAEVYPCGAELAGNQIIWDCFTGLNHDPKDGVVGSNFKKWQINLKDGSVKFSHGTEKM